MTEVAGPRLRIRIQDRVDPDAALVGLLALVVGVIWIYVVARAVDLAFTADESITYTLIHGLAGEANTANDQWLNTWLMRASQAVFGQSELALRLPNVLSFLLYGASAVAIARSLRSWSARGICFMLLMADPFAIEFFGLARGYGLSQAFGLAALAMLFGVRRWRSGWWYLGRLALVCAFGVLSFYANFSALNLTLAVIIATVIDGLAALLRHGAGGGAAYLDCTFATVPRERTAGSQTWSVRVPLSALYLVGGGAILAATALLMLPGVHHLEYLQSIGQLYYGGAKGVVQNTIATVVQTWGYVYSYAVPLRPWASALAWVVAGIGLLLVLWAAVDLVRRRRVEMMHLAALVLVVSVGAIQAEHWIDGTLFPLDRGALTYVLAFAVAAGFVVQHLAGRISRPRIRTAGGALAATVVALGALNFVAHVNTTSALTWQFDASAGDAVSHLMALAKQPGAPHPIRFVVPTPRYYAFWYYAGRLKRPWLQVIPGEPWTPDGDVYDVPPHLVGVVPKGYIKWVTLPEDGTQLWFPTPASPYRR